MKNTLLTFLFVLPLIGLLMACEQENGDEIQGKTTSLVIESLSGEKHSFDVEIARTPAELAHGLMFRESMPRDHGMLFIFNDSAERRFWMKNTLIPLDIIFIKADGTINRVHPEAVPHDLTSIPSYGPVKGVLEINGGVAQELGIEKGDRVRHALFENFSQ